MPCRGSRSFGKFEAHYQRYADGHVGVAGEIAVNLHGVSDDSHRGFKARVSAGSLEYEVVVLGYIVGYYGFLTTPSMMSHRPVYTSERVACLFSRIWGRK